MKMYVIHAKEYKNYFYIGADWTSFGQVREPNPNPGDLVLYYAEGGIQGLARYNGDHRQSKIIKGNIRKIDTLKIYDNPIERFTYFKDIVRPLFPNWKGDAGFGNLLRSYWTVRDEIMPILLQKMFE